MSSTRSHKDSNSPRSREGDSASRRVRARLGATIQASRRPPCYAQSQRRQRRRRKATAYLARGPQDKDGTDTLLAGRHSVASAQSRPSPTAIPAVPTRLHRNKRPGDVPIAAVHLPLVVRDIPLAGRRYMASGRNRRQSEVLQLQDVSDSRKGTDSSSSTSGHPLSTKASGSSSMRAPPDGVLWCQDRRTQPPPSFPLPPTSLADAPTCRRPRDPPPPSAALAAAPRSRDDVLLSPSIIGAHLSSSKSRLPTPPQTPCGAHINSTACLRVRERAPDVGCAEIDGRKSAVFARFHGAFRRTASAPSADPSDRWCGTGRVRLCCG